MDIAAALSLRDELEASLLSGAGVVSIQLGDRTITYETTAQATAALSKLNRDILAYQRRNAGVNPNTSRPRWR